GAPHHGQPYAKADRAPTRGTSEGVVVSPYCTAEMAQALQARRSLEIDLRNAVQNGEFQLVYQPQVDAITEEITGCEALLRWHSPSRGLVSPAEFVPLAEEIGLLLPIGDWVLRQACYEAGK